MNETNNNNNNNKMNNKIDYYANINKKYIHK